MGERSLLEDELTQHFHERAQTIFAHGGAAGPGAPPRAAGRADSPDQTVSASLSAGVTM